MSDEKPESDLIPLDFGHKTTKHYSYYDPKEYVILSREDWDYFWFIIENEGVWDSLSVEEYKRLHEIKKEVEK